MFLITRIAFFVTILSLTLAMPFREFENMDWAAFGSVEEAYQRVINNIHSDTEKYDFTTDWLVNNHYLADGDKEDKEAVGAAIIEAKNFYGLFLDDQITDEFMKKMAEPRCSKTDRKPRTKRWARLGGTWKNFPVTIKFLNHLQSSRITASTQKELARECAILWAEQSGVSFSWAPANSAGNIEISFINIDGEYGTVGRALSPSLPTSYLRLDKGEPWITRMSDGQRGVSMKWALCHEMGHNLGLGHASDNKAVMYPSGVHGRSDNQLGADDINGIQSLYGGSNGKTWVGAGVSSNNNNINVVNPPDINNNRNDVNTRSNDNNRNNFNTRSNDNNRNNFNTRSNDNNRNNFNTRSNDNNRNNFNTRSNDNNRNNFNTRSNNNNRNNFNTRNNNRRPTSNNQQPIRPRFISQNNQSSNRRFNQVGQRPRNFQSNNQSRSRNTQRNSPRNRQFSNSNRSPSSRRTSSGGRPRTSSGGLPRNFRQHSRNSFNPMSFFQG